MSVVHLLTYHSTVVCRDSITGSLVNCPVRDIGSVIKPVQCYIKDGRELSFDADHEVSIFSPNHFIIRNGQGGRTVTLERAGRYLRSFPSGQVDCHAFSAEGWEEYLLISEDTTDLLCDFIHNDWVNVHRHQVYRNADIDLLSDFTLRLGNTVSSFRWSLPIACERQTKRVLFFYDEWKVEELTLFRPLVYFVAFGEKYISMSFVGMLSSDYFSGALCHFLLITNLQEERVISLAPASLRGRIRVWTLHADEFFDYALQRFRIAEWQYAGEFQPLLYLDSDVVFDKCAIDLLVGILLSPKIMVANEPWSPLETSESVGRTLLFKDGCDTTGLGFNSGTIGVPNSRDHRLALRAIAEVMIRYATSTPGSRMALHWFDQSCANYVSVKLGHFDGDTLGNAMTFVGHGEEPADKPRGLVHFWGDKDKLSAMKKYLHGRLGMPPSDPIAESDPAGQLASPPPI